MRWQDQQESHNVEDRRGQSRGGFGGFGGFGRSSGGRGGVPVKGAGGILVLLVVMVAGYYGIDLSPLLEGGSALVPQQQEQQYQPTSKGPAPTYNEAPQEKELSKMSKVLLKTTEDTWGQIFNNSRQNYKEPVMVLYSGSTPTACGYGQAAMGPFYCPEDQKLYLDLSFYKDMQKKLGGGGDFAWGYVLAHEVGHHVQNLLGIADQVRQLQARHPAQQNALSVKLELQADCLAGVWGHNMQKRGLLEAGDLEKALRTAAAIGDDRLQKQAQGYVVPDSFTHGTSQQRYEWFKRGYDTGNPQYCDTFSKSKP